MNKKTNTVLFLLGATIFNVVTFIISFILLFLIFSYLIMPYVSGIEEFSFMIIFIASLAISFVVYNAVLKILNKKIEFEKYFDPIFANKFKKPK